MITREQAAAVGSRPWIHPSSGAVRIYFDNWADLLGLQVTRYGTGNIAGATLAGEPISNAEARRILAGDPKVWWQDGTIHITRGTHLAERYHAAITAAITAAVPAGAGQEPATTTEASVAARPQPTTPTTTAVRVELPDGTIELVMPRGPKGVHRVDLAALTPRARALAEAIAQTQLRWIRIKSVAPLRDLYASQEAAAFFGGDALNEPRLGTFESWADNFGGGRTVEQVLESEARKLHGWYPIADDGTDLPSSQAARADDGLTPGQAFRLLADLSAGVGRAGVEAWMRTATRGLDGHPPPVRHNGLTSLWSEQQLRDYARLQHAAVA